MLMEQFFPTPPIYYIVSMNIASLLPPFLLPLLLQGADPELIKLVRQIKASYVPILVDELGGDE